MWSASGLAQARSPRSGERSDLAQAVGSRLGETANRGPGRFYERSLKRGHLALVRWSFAQNSVFPPERALEQNPWASFYYSRLGETSSLGQN
ncbi:hypothetical protein DEO72_LG11g1411 [Vigna unguiculata]|uniref:Uncharacterized protein n=1 Tax=Vigna unguiculata TaxID=3917 RepID=A0A4D6NN96_VIGUN|nr:hypothetical protein DEO72_LG11g1411 [Vigna unguiculata]